ncbi:hypothetical protein PRIPAC_74424 [Pristionchus pacificus]|uniref:Abnormal cell migration protein 18-like fibronectin type I domain-containing protein n=1 Tax=Pristionchus pacificus TaxID=54126 RepID=A0A2A6BRK8_PRIPA|nr:hypothetical protein PRIPAC_74424 [Pristionchus pacificus]|eukprot:PDM68456.1 hypothetical protein PRIPAC_43958 [Pristionchus pacificus]
MGGYNSLQHAGNFINQCTVTGNCWTIFQVGCLTPDRKEIAVGSTATENGFMFKCMHNGRGVVLETHNEPTGAKTLARKKFFENRLCNGKYKNGERFKGLLFKCISWVVVDAQPGINLKDISEVRLYRRVHFNSYQFECG